MAAATGVVGPGPPVPAADDDARLLEKLRRSLNRTTPPGFAAWVACVVVTTAGSEIDHDVPFPPSPPTPPAAEAVEHDDRTGLVDGEEGDEGADEAEVEEDPGETRRRCFCSRSRQHGAPHSRCGGPVVVVTARYFSMAPVTFAAVLAPVFLFFTFLACLSGLHFTGWTYIRIVCVKAEIYLGHI